MMEFPVTTENWVGSQGGLDSGEQMNLLPLAGTDPRLLYGLVRRTEAILMSVFSIPNIPNSRNITALDILAGFLGYRINELTLNLKSTDAEWASVT
jgi:hypothetical protein